MAGRFSRLGVSRPRAGLPWGVEKANFTEKVQRLAGEGLLHIGIKNHDRSWRAGRPLLILLPLLGLALALAANRSAAAQAAHSPAPPAAPGQSAQESPTPQSATPVLHQLAGPCLVKNTGATMTATGSMRALAVFGFSEIPADAGATAVETKVCVPYLPIINWYARFLTGPAVKPFTPRQKALLAVHNLLDPFNLLTIAGEAGIEVAANSHTAYGPGFRGWAKLSGTNFTQDMTGEFFGTFLIPSLVHQDPHYHRMPTASVPRRVFHCVAQIAWTQGDNGRGMINYADLGGFAIDDAISNLYVPGQQTRFSASAERYAIGLALAPTDNFVTEFLPDVARHIRIRVVVIQRVINQVARTDNTAQ